MAKKKGGGKATKSKVSSSGKRKERIINRIVMRLKMKINRWKRYQLEISDGKRAGYAHRWDTAGLENHIKLIKKTT